MLQIKPGGLNRSEGSMAMTASAERATSTFRASVRASVGMETSR